MSYKKVIPLSYNGWGTCTSLVSNMDERVSKIRVNVGSTNDYL